MSTKRVPKSVAIACPVPSALQGYLLGRHPRQEMDLIHEHVKTCGACQQTLANFDSASDSLVDRLRQVKGPAATPADSDGAAKLIANAKLITRNQASPADAKAITRTKGAAAPAAPVPHFTVHFPGYRIMGQLGQGGCGTVYKVSNERMGGRIEALKTIKDPGDTQLRDRFRQEILAVARLEHPNIIRAYDTGVAGGLLYFTMEFASGLDLAKLVHERGGPLPSAEACTLICQAAEGLQIAHDKQIIHRDIKPSNLILNEHGYVQILDLGLARLIGQTDRGALLTGNAIIGTPIYMAPEQARDTHNVTAAVDIYSLGCTLYYLLTGCNPSAGRLVVDNPRIQPILERMVDPNPVKRHPSARAVIEDLHRFRFMGPISLDTMKKRSPGGTSLLPQSTVGQPPGSTASAPPKTALKPRLVAQSTAVAARPVTASAQPNAMTPAAPSIPTTRLEPNVALPPAKRSYVLHFTIAFLATVVLSASLFAAYMFFPRAGETQVVQAPKKGGDGPEIVMGPEPIDAPPKKDVKSGDDKGPKDGGKGKKEDVVFKKTDPPGPGPGPKIDTVPKPPPPPRDLTQDYDFPTGKAELYNLSGLKYPPIDVQISADSRLAVTNAPGFYNGEAIVWDLVGRGHFKTLDRNQMGPLHLFATTSVIAISANRPNNGGRVHTWNWRLPANDLSPPTDISFPQEWINRMTCSADGKFMAITTERGDIRVWNATSFGLVRELKHGSGVVSLSLSADGRYLVTGGNDSSVRLWENFGEKKQIRSFDKHKGQVWAVWITPNAKRIISIAAGISDNVITWDTDSGSPLTSFTLGNHAFSTITPDGRLLLTAEGQDVVLREIATGEIVQRFQGHTKNVRCISFFPDGRRAISGGDDLFLRVWQLPAPKNATNQPIENNTGEKPVPVPPEVKPEKSLPKVLNGEWAGTFNQDPVGEYLATLIITKHEGKNVAGNLMIKAPNGFLLQRAEITGTFEDGKLQFESKIEKIGAPAWKYPIRAKLELLPAENTAILNGPWQGTWLGKDQPNLTGTIRVKKQ